MSIQLRQRSSNSPVALRNTLRNPEKLKRILEKRSNDFLFTFNEGLLAELKEIGDQAFADALQNTDVSELCAELRKKDPTRPLAQAIFRKFFKLDGELLTKVLKNSDLTSIVENAHIMESGGANYKETSKLVRDLVENLLTLSATQLSQILQNTKVEVFIGKLKPYYQIDIEERLALGISELRGSELADAVQNTDLSLIGDAQKVSNLQIAQHLDELDLPDFARAIQATRIDKFLSQLLVSDETELAFSIAKKLLELNGSDFGKATRSTDFFGLREELNKISPKAGESSIKKLLELKPDDFYNAASGTSLARFATKSDISNIPRIAKKLAELDPRRFAIIAGLTNLDLLIRATLEAGGREVAKELLKKAALLSVNEYLCATKHSHTQQLSSSAKELGLFKVEAVHHWAGKLLSNNFSRPGETFLEVQDQLRKEIKHDRRNSPIRAVRDFGGRVLGRGLTPSSR